MWGDDVYLFLVLYGEQEKSNNSAEIQDPPLYFYDSTTSTSKQPITDKMAEGDEHINFPIFRDCLSSPLIQKSAAEPPKINRKARGRGGRKTAIKPVRTIVSSDEPNDAEELADFIDYVAREVYSSLPEDLRSLTYSTYINSKSLQASYAIPLATKTSSSILDCLPLSVGDSLSTYGMLPESTTPTELITPILNSYLDIVTTPPPLPHLTRQLATECETCLRSWIPLTFHHLIPRGVHAKALKRGWHTEDQLNNVAWLCPGLVGTVALELVDYNRLDPLAPTPTPRDLMISVFYPVQHVHRYPLARAYTDLYAEYLDTVVPLPNGTAELAVSQAYACAYLHPYSEPNILLFSPGYGNSRVDYTAALSDLASLGYIVIGVDHPYDTDFLDYPDGRIVINSSPPINSTEEATTLTEIRVADMRFVLDILSNNATVARQIPGVHGRIDGSRVGIFGHSLGGATAALTMGVDSRFACGSNLDGDLFGDVVETGLDKAFLLIGSGVHNRTSISDPGWETFYANSTGYKVEISVEGSVHGAFSDQAALYDDLRVLDLIPDLGDQFGTVKGERMLQIESAYLGALFGKCFTGKENALLKGPSDKFPEVYFWPA
ncbi:hypothetical protein B7494_g1816 [Chlorociboria aeruginascens]|nr:hypothetical protein B7494_g1816 [Chlorociboria aeruginascens]